MTEKEYVLVMDLLMSMHYMLGAMDAHGISVASDVYVDAMLRAEEALKDFGSTRTLPKMVLDVSDVSGVGVL